MNLHNNQSELLFPWAWQSTATWESSSTSKKIIPYCRWHASVRICMASEPTCGPNYGETLQAKEPDRIQFSWWCLHDRVARLWNMAPELSQGYLFGPKYLLGATTTKCIRLHACSLPAGNMHNMYNFSHVITGSEGARERARSRGRKFFTRSFICRINRLIWVAFRAVLGARSGRCNGTHTASSCLIHRSIRHAPHRRPQKQLLLYHAPHHNLTQTCSVRENSACTLIYGNYYKIKADACPVALLGANLNKRFKRRRKFGPLCLFTRCWDKKCVSESLIRPAARWGDRIVSRKVRLFLARFSQCRPPQQQKFCLFK